MSTLNGTVVHLLAGPYITVGPVRHEVPEGSKQLLAFVALRRGRVERRRAAGALWPLGDEERAAGNLRSALWRLRRAGIDVLVADKWSLVLGTDVRVDLHAVEEWATSLIDGSADERHLSIPPSASDALNLLPGVYDDWALIERERIRQRVLHALEALSERMSAAGRFADAIESAMLAASAEPLRESAQRSLVRAHIAEGNLTEARRTYLAYKALLHRELGILPSENFTASVGVAMVRVGRETAGQVPLQRRGMPAG
jgi:DNA-binding SARP family transcriptional activator